MASYENDRVQRMHARWARWSLAALVLLAAVIAWLLVTAL